jgi:hypothetical protein
VLAITAAEHRANAAQLRVLDYDVLNDPSDPYFVPKCNLKLVGEILPGDATRLEARLAAFEDALEARALLANSESAQDGLFRALCLSSPGGDIGEALKIGELLTEYMLVVDARDSCISACAIMLMRSKRRDGAFAYNGDVPGRYMHYSSRLGFHAPDLILPSDGNIDVAQVREAYARALLTIRSVIFGEDDEVRAESRDRALEGRYRRQLARKDLSEERRNGLERGLERLTRRQTERRALRQARGEFIGRRADMELIPLDLFRAFLAVPPNQLFTMTLVNEALHWGIDVFGLPPPRHISERMLKLACINVARVRCTYGGGRRECLGTSQIPINSRLLTVPDLENVLREVDRIYRWSATRLDSGMPGSKGYEVVGYAMHRKSREQSNDRIYARCEVMVTHVRGELVSIEVDTYNGQGRDWYRGSPLDAPTTQSSVKMHDDARSGGLKAAVFKSHLRPWKMLPGNTRLMELGNNSWRELEKGGPLRP